jgi:sugar/nucleoside kinase (ribokinase family)
METPIPKTRTGILAAGSWIVDHVKIIDRFPQQDTLATIETSTDGSGGSPYNILIDLAKLGATMPLQAAGMIGDDSDGRLILADCHAHGIDTSRMQATREAATSYTDVMTVKSTGRRTFFHCRGANALFDETHVDPEGSEAKHFHVGYLLLLDKLDEIAPDGTTGASRLLQRASESGMLTSVDLVSEDSDRFAAVMAPALPHIDFLIINELEAARTSGVDVMSDDKPDPAKLATAAARLIDAGVRRWVVIHYPEGALAYSADGTVVTHGSVRFPDEKIRGAAGAGDAFAAGALFGIHDELPMEECLKIAVCAAASNLGDPTCTGGILPLAGCLQLGETYGFR